MCECVSECVCVCVWRGVVSSGCVSEEFCSLIQNSWSLISRLVQCLVTDPVWECVQHSAF